MKKIVLLLLVISLCACSKNKDYTFELEGNPTTGYQWECKSSDNNIMEVKTEYTPNDDSLLGVGGKYFITLKGITSGKVTLTCEYKRNYSEEEYVDEKVEKKEYNFIVDNNLNVLKK